MKLKTAFCLVSSFFLLSAVTQSLPLALAQRQREPAKPTPVFLGDGLPIPPQQDLPWKPETKDIPERLLSATKKLFEQGLADPRGCEYRKLSIKVGSVWGSNSMVQVHGWLLPPNKSMRESGRFAVAWNGVVYPVLEVGEAVSLQTDILSMVSADEAMRAKFAHATPGRRFYRFRNAMSEGSSTSEKTLLPLKASLLLRLGEYDLARRVWTAWTSGMSANTNDDSEHLRDPYLMLATDWTWALFDRAVCAHITGDDRLSWLDARFLTTVEPLVEAEAAAREFRARSEKTTTPAPERKPIYLTFLEPLPALLADETRRVEKKKTTLKAVPNGPEEVGVLINNLDEISARQWGQPGGVSLSDDPQIEALIAAGDKAIEPLVDAFEHDTRLTRSVQFGRDFHYDRSFISVATAAYTALTMALETSSFAAPGESKAISTTQTRHEFAEQIRAYWKKYQGVSREDRWYEVLRNDKAGREAWLEAAGNIVRPRNITLLSRGSGIVHTLEKPLKPGQESLMTGEVLRAKANPSVSDLLALRTDQIGAQSEASSYNTIIKEKACDMALNLVKWEPVVALPALRKASERFQQAITEQRTNYGSEPNYMLKLLLARAALSDSKALDDYKAWLLLGKPEAERFVRIEEFQPLWQNPKNQVLAAASQFIFTDPSSQWVQAFQQSTEVQRVFESQLVRSPGMKVNLLNKLVDKSEYGVATLRKPEPEKGKLELDVIADNAGFYREVQPDPLKPKEGGTFKFRVCDFYAWSLWDHAKQHPGAPRFELYWPLAKRDAALRKSIEFIQKR